MQGEGVGRAGAQKWGGRSPIFGPNHEVQGIYSANQL